MKKIENHQRESTAAVSPRPGGGSLLRRSWSDGGEKGDKMDCLTIIGLFDHFFVAKTGAHPRTGAIPRRAPRPKRRQGTHFGQNIPVKLLW